MDIKKAIRIIETKQAQQYPEVIDMAIEALKEKQVAIEKYGEVNGSAYIQGIHDGADCEKSRILEKIKEEVKALKLPVNENCATNVTVDKVIAIIEKYTGEKDGENK